MLSRRRFIASSALTLAAGPLLAQELVSAETPLIEDPGPLRLDIGPAAVDASLTLPPTMEGDFQIPERRAPSTERRLRRALIHQRERILNHGHHAEPQ